MFDLSILSIRLLLLRLKRNSFLGVKYRPRYMTEGVNPRDQSAHSWIGVDWLTTEGGRRISKEEML
jgi:hypothetical protein